MSGSSDYPALDIGKGVVPLQNPLTTLQGWQSLSNAQATNRLMQNQNQLFQGHLAAGRAYQQATDADGNVNVPQAQALMAKDPNAATAMQESATSGQALTQEQYGLNMKRLQYGANGAMQILAANNGTAPLDQLKKFYDDAAAEGHLTPAQRDQQEAAFGDDPVQNAQVVRARVMTNLQTQQAMTAGQPSYDQQQRGGTINPIDVNPNTNPSGPGSPGNPVDMTNPPTRLMTPGSMSQPVGGASGGPMGTPTQTGVGPETLGALTEWLGTDGTRHQGTWAQFAIEHGAGRVAQGPPAPGTGRSPPMVPVAPGAAAPSPSTDASQAPQTPASAPAPTGYTSTQGPAPGIVEAAATTAKQNADMGGALMTRADTVPTNKANYGNMLSDLQKLDSMGPGTSREAAANAFTQKLTGYGITMSKDQVAGAESFGKIANMIAAQQLGSIGPTDARQSLAMGANPHLDLSKLGNTQIIHMLQGNEDAISAKAKAWQQWIAPTSKGGLGNSPGSYAQFSTDFNHNFDPRVFQAQYMGPSEIANMRKSLTGPGEAQRFKSDYMHAKQQGWIGDPSGQNGQ